MAMWNLRLDSSAEPPDPRDNASQVDVCSLQRSDSKSPSSVDQSKGDVYRMYKRRWIGVVALMVLNIVGGMSLVWFGPIADDTVDEFGFNLDQVNWLGNCINLTFLPCAAVVPVLYVRLGLRRTCYAGGALFVVAAWVRYAGTASSLSVAGKYTLIMVGQIISGVVQPIFQVLIPGYSEKWFDLRQRTTATMLMSIANPIGVALGQLISPLVGTPSESILVLAIIYTAVAPFVLLIADAPPTPPTHAAAQNSPSFASFVRALFGREDRDRLTYMTVRQRCDFVILNLAFGVLVAAISTFSILSEQYLEPYGYSDDTAGLMGATLLLVGIVSTALTAPLFDRVFTHHLALTTKFLCPILGGAWLSLIWAVHVGDTGGLFAIMALIGASGLTLLPVALELAVETTRNADASSAVLWSSTNLFSIIFVLCEGAMRAGADSDPPYNMRRGLIFQGAFVCATVLLVFFLEGRQTRRAADEQAQAVHGNAVVLGDLEHEMAEVRKSPKDAASGSIRTGSEDGSETTIAETALWIEDCRADDRVR